jgi:hypothetical protein
MFDPDRSGLGPLRLSYSPVHVGVQAQILQLLHKSFGPILILRLRQGHGCSGLEPRTRVKKVSTDAGLGSGVRAKVPAGSNLRQLTVNTIPGMGIYYRPYQSHFAQVLITKC